MSLDATLWAWRQPVTPLQKIVLLAMADRAGEDHSCCPHISRLSADTGMPAPEVQDAIADLECLGLVRSVEVHEQISIVRLVGVHGREAMPLMREVPHEP